MKIAPLAHSPSPVLGLAFLVLAASHGFGASIPEPETSLFGKVISRDGNQSQMLMEGELTWKVRRPDASEETFVTNLTSLGKGTLSYQFKIPHSALASGLTAQPGTLALAGEEATFENFEITVDGYPARIVDPEHTLISVRQRTRAFTHRIDLEVAVPMKDSDNDGLPDWWEEQYGLDPQLANATGDPDGDGLTNLQEYRAGSDPTHDNSEPTLLTTGFVAYAEGTTAVPLATADTNSGPDQLFYTLTKAPESGELFLRNAIDHDSEPDQLLEAGAGFTQADVQKGRLIFVSAGTFDDPVSFEITVRDEDPDHEAVSGVIEVTSFRPTNDVMASLTGDDLEAMAAGDFRLDLAKEENLRLQCYLLSRESDYVVRETMGNFRDVRFGAPTAGFDPLEYHEEYFEKYGSERPHIIIAGSGHDHLSGGMGSDILIGGPGDDQLAGGGDGDQFVFLNVDSGSDLITDFQIEGDDVIDLTGMLTGTSNLLSDYVDLDAAQGNLILRIDADGDGSGFTDATIELAGVSGSSYDLYALLEKGCLRTGGLTLVPRISVAASTPLADENDLLPGEFLLTRQGSTEERLEVSLSVSGSAQNGFDFSMIDDKAVFQPGKSTVAIPVLPFADNQAEPRESVELVLISGNGYTIGGSDRASVEIDDLQMIVSIESLAPLAVQDSLSPAVFLIRRKALLDRAAVVLLKIDGSASNGIDYQRIPLFVNFFAGQSTAVLEIIPNPNANLDSRGETVVISVRPDSAYRLGDEATARITLIERERTFAAWLSDNDPDFEADPAEVALLDPGQLGIPNLNRYAHGMDWEAPDQSKLPRLKMRDGHLTMDVSLRAAATDLEVIVEASTDLVTWDSSPASVEELHLPEHRDRADITTFRAVGPINESQVRYLRVRVVRNQ